MSTRSSTNLLTPPRISSRLAKKERRRYGTPGGSRFVEENACSKHRAAGNQSSADKISDIKTPNKKQQGNGKLSKADNLKLKETYPTQSQNDSNDTNPDNRKRPERNAQDTGTTYRPSPNKDDSSKSKRNTRNTSAVVSTPKRRRVSSPKSLKEDLDRNTVEAIVNQDVLQDFSAISHGQSTSKKEHPPTAEMTSTEETVISNAGLQTSLSSLDGDDERQVFMSVAVALEPTMLAELEARGYLWKEEIKKRPDLQLFTKTNRHMVVSTNVASITALQAYLREILDCEPSGQNTDKIGQGRIETENGHPEDECGELSSVVLEETAIAETSKSRIPVKNSVLLPQPSTSQTSTVQIVTPSKDVVEMMTVTGRPKILSSERRSGKKSSKGKTTTKVKASDSSSPPSNKDVATHKPDGISSIPNSSEHCEWPELIDDITVPPAELESSVESGSQPHIPTESSAVPPDNHGVLEIHDSLVTSSERKCNRKIRPDELKTNSDSDSITGKPASETDATTDYDLKTDKDTDTILDRSKARKSKSIPSKYSIENNAQSILNAMTKTSNDEDNDSEVDGDGGIESGVNIDPVSDASEVDAETFTESSRLKHENILRLYNELIASIVEEPVNNKVATDPLLGHADDCSGAEKKETGKSGKFTCDICNDYTGSRSAIKSHKYRHHSSVIYRCDICKRTFGLRRECIRHRITHCFPEQKPLFYAIMTQNRNLEKGSGEISHLKLDKVYDNLLKSGKATMLSDPSNATHTCRDCEYKGTKFGLDSHRRRYHPKTIITCEICQHHFGTQHQLNIHMAKHVTRENKAEAETGQDDPADDDMSSYAEYCISDDYKSIHKCDICGYESTKSGVRHHKDRHHREKNLECDICKKKFGRKCDIRSHRMKHFDKEGKLRPIQMAKSEKYSQLHQCEICGFKSTFFGLKSHKRREHMEKRHQCSICLKKFIDRKTMTNHTATHFTSSGQLKPWMRANNSDESKWGGFPCPECESEFPSKRACDVHVARAHPMNRKYMCEYCLFNARTKDEIDKHVARKHQEHEFTCDICKKTYAFKHDLQFHVNTVHENKEQCRCDICGKQFQALKYLKTHMQRHEGKYRYYCPQCNKGFMAKARMNEHIEVHKPQEERNMNFCCEVCGKRFIRKSTWLQHMDGHLGNRKHKCTLCEKGFTLPQSLSRHMKSHDTKKQYACTHPSCTKTFLDKTSRDYHSVTHTGVSKHTCATCGKAFTQAATLRRHACKWAVRKMIAVAKMQPKTEVQEGNTMEIQSTEDIQSTETHEASSGLMSMLNAAVLSSNGGALTGTKDELENMGLQLDDLNSDVLIVMNESAQEVASSDLTDQLQLADQNQQNYMCSVCEQLFDTWEDIKVHMEIHTEGEGQLLDTDDNQQLMSEVDTGEHMVIEVKPEAAENGQSTVLLDTSDIVQDFNEQNTTEMYVVETVDMSSAGELDLSVETVDINEAVVKAEDGVTKDVC